MKVRQKVAMALCAFYLISVIGVAISMHFCSGKLSSTKFASTATCSACKDGKKTSESHDCCKNTAVNAKITDSHEPGFKVQLPGDFSTQLFLFKSIFDLINTSPSKAVAVYVNRAPPLSSVLSLHIYNCVFRN